MTDKNEKKPVETKPAVKEQKKNEIGAAVKGQKPKQATKAADEGKKPKVDKPEMVNIFSTTYGYYRHWVKNILAEGGVSKFRFVKDAGSYNGKLAVAKAEVEKAKKVLADYKLKHPDETEMWK